ncbi:IseA DL-endopeptidase inhibitor family protein [Bacillus sp. FJAT-49736]|uniref:IseA DL-endopeptidase inhibitor family protein n=1 Tax=Bacillus sp. FJAT-49736 TaxID=2833582 RepID=UPI001BC95D16|nr:IseA DL-endopeptidase inhibitor family protein [Bacillus sp. FJAT-49736]MBS4175487.1 IseA DL-endopeptidase inhibitor family protein [Bacillus sp. FJAT-49736]
MKKLLSALLALTALFTFSIGASAQTTSKQTLTNTQALKLAVDARTHFWSVMSGSDSKIKHKSGVVKTFTYKGMEYRYFSKEFDSKPKLVKYMNEAYTLNAIEKGFKKYHFITYKGKLAQPNADFGSLLEWDKAKVKLLYQRKDVRLYEFIVPYGKNQNSKQRVTFVKVGNKWQINDFDAVH